jgi:hypothetical protein
MAGLAYFGANLGGGTLPVAGDYAAFIGKFSADGVHLTSTTYGGAASASLSAIAKDASSNIILSGHFDEFIDFGNGGVLAGPGPHLYLAKLDPNGAHVWSKSFDGNVGVSGLATAESSMHIILGGGVSGLIDFGAGVLRSAGGYDAYVTTFAP